MLANLLEDLVLALEHHAPTVARRPPEDDVKGDVGCEMMLGHLCGGTYGGECPSHQIGFQGVQRGRARMRERCSE